MREMAGQRQKRLSDRNDFAHKPRQRKDSIQVFAWQARQRKVQRWSPVVLGVYEATPQFFHSFG